MHFQTIHYILYPGKFQRVISGSQDHFLPAMIVHPFDQLAPGNEHSPADPQAGKIVAICQLIRQLPGNTQHLSRFFNRQHRFLRLVRAGCQINLR